MVESVSGDGMTIDETLGKIRDDMESMGVTPIDKPPNSIEAVLRGTKSGDEYTFSNLQTFNGRTDKVRKLLDTSRIKLSNEDFLHMIKVGTLDSSVEHMSTLSQDTVNMLKTSVKQLSGELPKAEQFLLDGYKKLVSEKTDVEIRQVALKHALSKHAVPIDESVFGEIMKAGSVPEHITDSTARGLLTEAVENHKKLDQMAPDIRNFWLHEHSKRVPDPFDLYQGHITAEQKRLGRAKLSPPDIEISSEAAPIHAVPEPVPTPGVTPAEPSKPIEPTKTADPHAKCADPTHNHGKTASASETASEEASKAKGIMKWVSEHKPAAAAIALGAVVAGGFALSALSQRKEAENQPKQL